MSKKTKIIVGVAVVLGLGVDPRVLPERKGPQPCPASRQRRSRKSIWSPRSPPTGRSRRAGRWTSRRSSWGRSSNLAVKEGDHVHKNQLLLQIDKAQLAAAAQGREASLAAMRHDLDAARATAEQAKRDYERAKGNFDAHILSEAESQKAKSALDTAQATLEATEQRMNGAVANLAGEPRFALQDDGDGADRRDRHRPSGQGGRGHRHRHDEQPRHAAPDDLRHVRGRGRDDGGRDLGARRSRSGQPANAERSTPIRTASSRDSSPRSAHRPSRRTIRTCSP